MEKDLDALQILYLELQKDETCPLKLSCNFLLHSELKGEVFDCLLRFLQLKLSNVNPAFRSFLVNFIYSKLDKEDLSSCYKEDGNGNPTSTDLVGEAVAQKLFKLLKNVSNDLSLEDIHINTANEIDKHQVCLYSTKNKRRKMEDRHLSFTDINSLFDIKAPYHQSFFAVLDGHGGIDAANYAASQMIMKLVASSLLLTDAEEALRQSILETDRCFTEKAKNEKLRSGTTLVCSLIQGNTLTIAWLGDSQVIICKSGKAIQLMVPHKPDNEDEKERIEKLGGSVMWFGGWRVNGQLSVSRAIGDVEQKPYISSEPETDQFEFEGDEEFLILACDGLWDNVDPYDAVVTATECINNDKKETVASTLVDMAIKNGSMDNITVLVVYLNDNKSETPSVSICSNIENR